MENNIEKPNVFYIDQILDKSTFIIAGENIGKLENGEKLSILARGQIIKNTGIPVVVIKAKLEVKEVTSLYVIARPLTQTKKEPISNWASIMPVSGSNQYRTINFIPDLDVLEEEERGNPAKEKVHTGDIVIREDDYRKYVDSLTPKILKKEN